MTKKKKYPKQPKMSASLATWEKYEARCKAVTAHNKALADKPKKIEAIKTRVQKAKV